MANYLQAPSHHRNGKGKKKVSMEKIKSRSDLLVTFSKRCSGLFKKASELSTLTGSKIGVIVFTPGGKVVSFGHPSIHHIINEQFPDEVENVGLRNNVVVEPRFDGRLLETYRNLNVAEHNMWLSKAEMRMELLRKWMTAIEAREKEEMAGQVNIEDMVEEELVKLKAQLNGLKNSLMMMESWSVMPSQVTTMNPVHGDIGNPSFLPTS